MVRCIYTFLLWTLVLAALAGRLDAHPIGFSGFRFLIYQDKAKAIFTLHTRDLSDWFPPATNGDYINDVCKQIIADPAALLDVRFDGKTVESTEKRAFVAEEGLIQVELMFPIKAMPGQIELWSKHLVHLPAGHQQLLFVEDMRARPMGLSGASVFEGTLSREDDHVTVDVPPPPLFVELPQTQPTMTTMTSQPTSHAILPAPHLDNERNFHMRELIALLTASGFLLILIAFQRRRQRG